MRKERMQQRDGCCCMPGARYATPGRSHAEPGPIKEVLPVPLSHSAMQNNPTPWFPPLRGGARGAVMPSRSGSPSVAEHDPAKLASYAVATPNAAALAGGHQCIKRAVRVRGRR